VFDIELGEAPPPGRGRAQEAAEKLLANTVIENYQVEVTG